jgi:hypothetical protein
MAGGLAQGVSLGSNPSTAKKKKKIDIIKIRTTVI